MKRLFNLNETCSIYASGEKRYQVSCWSKGWPNMCGREFHAFVKIFTEHGWTDVFNIQEGCSHQFVKNLPDYAATDEKFREFKRRVLSMVVAFHDGE